jgi:SAM-dependent methyltransferase
MSQQSMIQNSASIGKNSPEKVIVNLGCGKTKIPGVIGLDRVPIAGVVDIVHDLDVVPYPFAEQSVDEIHMYHVLEHLHDPVRKMEELYRILKPQGTLFLRVPHFSSNGAWTDITHVRPFSYFSFDCFQEDSYQHFYTTAVFAILHRRLKYFGLYPNTGLYAKYIHENRSPWLLRPFIRGINFLMNLSPMFFERVWCYWIGGACEVEFILKRINPKGV